MEGMALRRLILAVNFSKEEAAPLVERIKRWGEEHGLPVEVYDGMVEAGEVEIEAELGPGTVVVTLGGDGTFLRAAGRFAPKGVPLLGINLGSLGFLTQVGAEEALEALEKLRRGEFELEGRMMLEGRLGPGGGRFLALNDFVLSRPEIEGFTELELSVDGELVAHYPGDGLIIATPTGASAYSLAAGGPIISPELDLFVVTALAPHKLGLRPLILPPRARLKVIACQPATLLADGDQVGELAPGEELLIDRADLRTKMVSIHPRPGLFYLLERELNWGRGSNRSRGCSRNRAHG